MVAKGLCVRGKLETEQTATYWPPVPLSLTALLSHSAGLPNRGFRGSIAVCWVLVLSTAFYLQLDWLQLTEPVCGTGLYNCWHPPASYGRYICTQFNPSTVKVLPWYLRADAPVPWSTARSEVNMLHRIRPWKSTIQPDAGFNSKNPKQDSTLKTHSQTMLLHLVPCKHTKHIV